MSPSKMTREDDIYDIEKSNIDELRRRLKDLMPKELYEDDNVFERFLRARNQNLDAAEAMLRNHLRWRKSYKIEDIRNKYQPAEVLVKHDIMNRLCFDKEGYPVIYVAFGKLDFRGFEKCAPLSDFFTYVIYHFENYLKEMKEKSKQLGKPINQWVMIFDYESFLLSNATHKPSVQFIINLMSMYEANYPERLKAAYLINGSIVFQICFAMCKPFLTGATFQKVRILGADFREEFAKIIDAQELPAFLGGNRTDTDGNPRCLQTVKFGGVVSPSYYRSTKERKLSVIPDARFLIVSRLSKQRVEVEVIHPGSTIDWRYTVKNRNINFSVFYKGHREVEDSEGEEVLPKQRVETVESSEKGMCLCDKAGIYVLEFDNSFSWLHSKHIYYSVNVSKP